MAKKRIVSLILIVALVLTLGLATMTVANAAATLSYSGIPSRWEVGKEYTITATLVGDSGVADGTLGTISLTLGDVPAGASAKIVIEHVLGGYSFTLHNGPIADGQTITGTQTQPIPATLTAEISKMYIHVTVDTAGDYSATIALVTSPGGTVVTAPSSTISFEGVVPVNTDPIVIPPVDPPATLTPASPVPTVEPTVAPTVAPTAEPTVAPTAAPTAAPGEVIALGIRPYRSKADARKGTYADAISYIRIYADADDVTPVYYKVFPKPKTGEITQKITVTGADDSDLEAVVDSTDARIDFYGYTPGTYYLSLKSNDGRVNKAFRVVVLEPAE